jgi:nitrogen fixation/metabolism regulation signal transduction histidine kinase
MARRWRRLSFDAQILAWALAVGLPGGGVALLLLWTGEFSAKLRWTATLFVVLGWLALALALRRRVVFPIYTLANLIEALREGDYSLRGRRGGRDDALGQVLSEVNLLADGLHTERLGAREATLLLQRVMAEIEVAVFALDPRDRVVLVNRAGEKLLARPAERLLRRPAEEVGLGPALAGGPFRTTETVFPGGEGRWEIRRRGFRLEGRPHRLVVIADLSRTLREEERQAWKRLIRVLGHELNNSLAPIKSMAATLAGLLAREPRPGGLDADLRRGLEVIGNRAEALARFMGAYSRLARLPPPTRAPTPVRPLVERAAALETRVPVAVEPGPPVVLEADADQLEQLLINLLANAADAALATGGGIRVGWRRRAGRLELWVRDDGPGLSNPENVFVPFYTTKPGGTGVGLVLCRQIAEAHGGDVTLANRRDGRGAEAVVRLPLGERTAGTVAGRPG